MALVAPAASCSAAAPLVTVDKLLAQCSVYLGKPVRLAGYLGDCAGYDCHLAVDRSRWNGFATAINELLKKEDAFARAVEFSPVGVGSNDAFDLKAKPLQHSYVVITGRMDEKNCDGQGGTDRSPGIHPTDIRPWTKSEGAPADAQ